MFNFFSKNGIGPIGLDLSDCSVEAVQLKETGPRFELSGFSNLELPSGLIERGQVKDLTKLSRLLGEMIAKPKFGKFHGAEAVINLPEEKVFTHLFDFSPPLVKENLTGKISEGIKEILPLDLSDLDWGSTVTFETQLKQEVFWAGVPKITTKALKDISVRAGLNLVAFDLESLALARSVVADPSKEGPVLLVDLGGKSSFVAIFDGFGLWLTHSLPLGGHSLTQTISDQLKIPNAEAEKLKRQFGFSQSSKKIDLILQGAIQPLIEEIGHLSGLYQRRSGQKLLKVILTGGSSLIPKIDFYLSQRLQLTVEMGKVWVDLVQKFPDNMAILFPISIGLALYNYRLENHFAPKINFL